MNYRMLVGLGNPGKGYERNRHNVGFMLLDQLAGGWRCSLNPQGKFRAEWGKVTRGDHQWLLVKPLTFMNASGEAVQRLAAFYQVPPSEILVVYDDLDLPLGAVRCRPDGSSGGHNGMKSIESRLGTRQFPRLRIGIGRDDRGKDATISYVLSDFSKSEKAHLEQSLQRAENLIEEWGNSSLEKAMSLFNGRIQQGEPTGKTN
jgi:PTH1 family peptidyl-tRNA hydrolase